MAPSEKPSNKSPEYFSHAREEIEPLLPDRIGSVLEIGCGAGSTLGWLRSIRKIDYAMGVEIVPEVAARARAVFDEVVCGNIEVQPLDTPRRFDAILALDVLEHLANPWDAVRSLSKFLAPGGVFIASIPNIAHWKVSLPLLWRGEWEYMHDGILDKTHLRFFTEQTARALFEDEGFVIRKINYVKIYPGRTSAQRWLIQKYLGCFIPSRLSNYQFLIRAERH